jgi:UPF0716 protein FxsA
MWIVVALLALPLVEIGLFVTLGAQLGLWLTLAWVVLTGVAGVLLLKGLALAGRRGLRDGLQEGLQDPLSPIAHKALMGVAGVLLILPGFFTDALGLILLLPPVRSLLIGQIARRMRGITIVQRGTGSQDDVYEHRPYDDRLN